MIMGGCSKTHIITGWRLGHGITRADLLERIALLLAYYVGLAAQFIL